MAEHFECSTTGNGRRHLLSMPARLPSRLHSRLSAQLWRFTWRGKNLLPVEWLVTGLPFIVHFVGNAGNLDPMVGGPAQLTTTTRGAESGSTFVDVTTDVEGQSTPLDGTFRCLPSPQRPEQPQHLGLRTRTCCFGRNFLMPSNPS